MRIIHTTQQEGINISVFRSGNKLILKFEKDRISISMDLDDREGVNDLDGVLNLLNNNFLKYINQQLRHIYISKNEIYVKSNLDYPDFPIIT